MRGRLRSGLPSAGRWLARPEPSSPTSPSWPWRLSPSPCAVWRLREPRRTAAGGCGVSSSPGSLSTSSPTPCGASTRRWGKKSPSPGPRTSPTSPATRRLSEPCSSPPARPAAACEPSRPFSTRPCSPSAWPASRGNWLIGAQLRSRRAGAPGSGSIWPIPSRDLVILFAFTSFFLRVQESAEAPRPYYVVLCVAFLVQMVADTGYAASRRRELLSGKLARSCLAARLRARRRRRPYGDTGPARHRSEAPEPSDASASSAHRLRLEPVETAHPLHEHTHRGGDAVHQAEGERLVVDPEAWVLTYLGLALIGLLLVRQYIALAQNRRLNLNLTHASSRVGRDSSDALADLNARLEGLNGQIHVLNSLRDQRSIAEEGLRMACSFAKSPGGWITLRNEQGIQVVTATLGPVALHRPGESQVQRARGGERRACGRAHRDQGREPRHPLAGPPRRTRSEPPTFSRSSRPRSARRSTTPGRYEEVLHLAERDPLTGLFNHRGIHQRLAVEGRRAQQNRDRVVAGHDRPGRLQAAQRHVRPPRRATRCSAR